MAQHEAVTEPSRILLAAALGLPLVLGLALWQTRRRARRLRRRLEAAASDLENLQQAFSRFAPDEIVEQIASGVSTRAERQEVTALFADLVGFTALSESLVPGVLVRILNGYFEHMSRAITAHRGHVSTLVGDGILALFGALQPNPWQSNDAVYAALAMRRELEDYNQDLARQGLPALSVGVGIHCGVGVAGLVGSRDLMQFAVVGRIVNRAARVQELTRQHGVDILVTREVKEKLDPRFVLKAMPPSEVRGVQGALATYAIEPR